MSRGGGRDRGREPVGSSKDEVEKRDAHLPSLHWSPMFRTPAPRFPSLCHYSPKAVQEQCSLYGQGRKPETAQNGGVNLQGDDRMLASDTEIGVRHRRVPSSFIL
jgi:hypothetical protein